MSLSETLSRLTMNLNRRPDLTRRLRVVDDDNRKSVAESSAEIIQKIFTTCLTDRSGTRTSKPEGKRVGIYMFANLVLKLLFAVCFILPFLFFFHIKVCHLLISLFMSNSVEELNWPK